MLDPSALPSLTLVSAACATFLVAGITKGIVGFGLPTVALSLLAAGLGLKSAVVLTVFPALFTNIWQACVGGHGLLLLKRLGPFLVACVFGVAVGTIGLAYGSGALLTLLLAALITLYALAGLAA
ncbi:MAG: sulfite exporter TauE/SafE family protein, partial [Pseudomonadota bacterium]